VNTDENRQNRVNRKELSMNQTAEKPQLNKKTAQAAGWTPAERPVKVLQFGEGNFLRAFIDWMIHEMNDQGLFGGNVTVVQPLEHGMIDALEDQDYLYTLLLRGVQNGRVVVEKQIIDVIGKGLNVYRTSRPISRKRRIPS